MPFIICLYSSLVITYGVKTEIKTNPSLRLYIKLTDQCFANCKFCANEQNKDLGILEIEKLAFIIRYLKTQNLLHGISITGGEPKIKKL